MRFCTIRTKTAVLHNLTLYLLALSAGSSTIITESLIHSRHNTTYTSASKKRALRKKLSFFSWKYTCISKKEGIYLINCKKLMTLSSYRGNDSLSHIDGVKQFNIFKHVHIFIMDSLSLGSTIDIFKVHYFQFFSYLVNVKISTIVISRWYFHVIWHFSIWIYSLNWKYVLWLY